MNEKAEDNRKTILILGDFELESVNDKIHTLGFAYQYRSLFRSSSYWQGNTVEQYLKQLSSSGDLLTVLMFLSLTSFLHPENTEHFEDWHHILNEMKGSQSLIFIDERFCLFNLLDFHFDHSAFNTLFNEFLNLSNSFIDNHNVELLSSRIKGYNHNFSIFIKQYPSIFMFDNSLNYFSPLTPLKDVDTSLNTLMQVGKLYRETHDNSILDTKSQRKLYNSIKRQLNDLKIGLNEFQLYYSEKIPIQLRGANQLLKIIQESGIEIVPYKTKREISIRVHHFLDEIDKSAKSLEYDVAISYAGEDRSYAEALAEVLRNRGVNVFYDKYEKAVLWGQDLYTYLSDLYQNKSRYCILFLSKSYAGKVWTKHELQSAQARALKEQNVYILPIRLDDTQIPGILPTTAYLDWSQESPEIIADLLVEKLIAV